MILNDHDDFTIFGEHLKGKRIALVVTGGIAAYTAPKIIRALRMYSCEVFPYATKAALDFVTTKTLAWASKHTCITELSDKSEHLGQDNQTFDAVVVYPATYDFIGKIAGGIADDACSTLIASHIRHSKVILVPAMHGNMWDSFILQTNLERLRFLTDMVHPVLKNGKANVPDTQDVVCQVVRLMSTSRLVGKKILVTAGPTPVKIDNVRRMTNKFSGKLGIEIANELFLRGADVLLYQSCSGIRPPKYLPSVLFQDYDDYKQLCVDSCRNFQYGIFSAAVADYKPAVVFEGKIPSRGALSEIKLVQTEKVIDLVHEAAPDMKMISFKYEEGKTLSELLEIADRRLKSGHHRVVANDLTLNDGRNQQCFLMAVGTLATGMEGVTYIRNQAYGKVNIARMIANDMERDPIL